MHALDDRWTEELRALCGLKSASTGLPGLSVPGPEILDKDICRDILNEAGRLLGSRSRKITASLLSKRIAFLTTAATLYPMSLYNRGLDLSLENCVIDYSHDSKRWQSSMYLYNLDASPPPPGARETWREDVCRRLFSTNLARLWQALHEASGVTLSILWENTAVRVYSLYERRLMSIGDMDTARQIREDFTYLTTEAAGSLFGCKDNPLQRFYFDKTAVGEREIRYRRTCCYYYLTPPQEYCSTCPLLLSPGKKSKCSN
ncbi:IucA/IucC family C-terminal-domain containing protein [Thalassospira xianhensis]|uniref:Siderophore-iron reductase, Fe-S cluster protein n=1 Tax=Thalassospira xianhensis MCCC 1A02616 TaxID=1177929 RepID=A0A367U7Z9_9PROT|nr:IucA/IucC family C-terminal-domain containing protein [Thalassospira xianhensis]RCK04219.1 hypothetical protein TH5_20820 [Thalassospira xianhensis MCCC 1A02616]